MNGIIDKTWVVYRHIAPNGKMYVGITSINPLYRWNNGNGYYKQPLFFNAIKKYGWDNFKHEILLEGLTLEEANLAEKIFISYWNLTDTNFGYNLEGGGRENIKISESTRKKMSESMMGDKNPMFGKRHTEETKRKISAAHKGEKSSWYGRKHTEETKRKISKSNIGKHSNKLTEEQIEKIKNNAPSNKPVSQLNVTTNEVINIYRSTREAERQTGIPHQNIAECCKGKRKSAGGYKWEYLTRITK